MLVDPQYDKTYRSSSVSMLPYRSISWSIDAMSRQNDIIAHVILCNFGYWYEELTQKGLYDDINFWAFSNFEHDQWAYFY